MLPRQDGTGGTFNFQDRIAFWFGMDLCDNQSAPEFTHDPCTPNSDTNIFDGADPTQARLHRPSPGHGVPRAAVLSARVGALPERHQLRRTQVVRGDGDLQLQQRPEHRRRQQRRLPEHGRRRAGELRVHHQERHAAGTARARSSHARRRSRPTPPRTCSWARATRSTSRSTTPPTGSVTEIRDLTTGQSGSMTASVANGFAQVNYEPTASTCTQTPYAFHPMYSTSSEHTRVPWAAHSYNVAFSDEIGHFEYCDRANPHGTCVNPGVNDRKKDARRHQAASTPTHRCGSGSAGASPPTTTSTASPTRRRGRDR